MTPEMSATRRHLRAQDDDDRRVAVARTGTGASATGMIARDPQDEQYGCCYPERRRRRLATVQGPERHRRGDDRSPPRKLALDALQDLVRYLRGVREERKAILAITDGWLLYRPNNDLDAAADVPGRADRPTVTGRSTVGQADDAATQPGRVRRMQCDADRMRLGADRQRRAVPRDARRGQPRERVVLSDRSARAGGVRYADDAAGRARAAAADDASAGRPGDARAARINSLRTLAEATDGLAIVDSNDLAGGLRRVGRRPELILPARLLLDRQAGWTISSDHRPRQAAGRPSARGAAISLRRRPPRRRRRERGAGAAARPAVSAEAEASERVIAAAIAPLVGLRARTAAPPAGGRRLEAGQRGVRGAVGRRRAGERGGDRRRLQRGLRGHAHAVDAGRPDRGQRNGQCGQGRAHVPRAGDADPAADRGRLRAARRRTRRHRIDPVAGDHAARGDRGARLIRRDLHPPEPGPGNCRPRICGSGATNKSASKSRRPASDPSTARLLDRNGQVAGRAGDCGGARRCRRVALAYGAARARAARAARTTSSRLTAGSRKTMAGVSRRPVTEAALRHASGAEPDRGPAGRGAGGRRRPRQRRSLYERAEVAPRIARGRSSASRRLRGRPRRRHSRPSAPRPTTSASTSIRRLTRARRSPT